MLAMPETEIFRALADPTRRAVFERLSGAELSVSELTAGFSVSQPAISQHLAALRGAGLVTERREGRFIYYRAEANGLAPLLRWVDQYHAFWPDRLQKLRNVLKEMDE
jgi:DNA-binding transcriptional ArsR family regulator